MQFRVRVGRFNYWTVEVWHHFGVNWWWCMKERFWINYGNRVRINLLVCTVSIWFYGR